MLTFFAGNFEYIGPLNNGTGIDDIIFAAASDGCVEVIKVLAPFTFNINAHNKTKYTLSPISAAVENGHVEVIKLMATLMDNPYGL